MRARPNHRNLFHAITPALAALLLAAVVIGSTTAAELPSAAPSARVNMTVSYKADPAWPQRPAGVEFSQMAGVAVDAKDQIYLHTRANPPVQVYTADGKYIRGWGQDVIGTAHYLRIGPKGNVWVTCLKNHTVMKFTPEGKLLMTLGTPGESGDDARHFNKPTDMAITPAGDIFVSDGYGNSRVVHFDRNGKFVKAWGKPGTGPGEFNLVHSIVVDSQGTLYVADRSNARIQVFDQNGKFLAQWRNLLVPWGLCVTKDDEIWACGSSAMIWPDDGGLLGCPPKDQVFMKFDRTGRLLQLWTIPKGENGEEKPGEVNWLHAIALDSKGNIYAGDIQGKKAQKFVRAE
ncbi:MAG: 6-bladed beta-propeller [Candidatus Nealsonbacteria bacterium]|nr:6-bladed beta-propeller [Candidatus Nealsonbacteria bacterium]